MNALRVRPALHDFLETALCKCADHESRPTVKDFRGCNKLRIGGSDLCQADSKPPVRRLHDAKQ